MLSLKDQLKAVSLINKTDIHFHVKVAAANFYWFIAKMLHIYRVFGKIHEKKLCLSENKNSIV